MCSQRGREEGKEIHFASFLAESRGLTCKGAEHGAESVFLDFKFEFQTKLGLEQENIASSFQIPKKELNQMHFLFLFPTSFLFRELSCHFLRFPARPSFFYSPSTSSFRRRSIVSARIKRKEKEKGGKRRVGRWRRRRKSISIKPEKGGGGGENGE